MDSTLGVVCTRGTSGNVNAFLYNFTWTGAHPLGANFGANVLYYTTSTSAAQPLGVITAGISATSIGVWLRAKLLYVYSGTIRIVALTLIIG